MTYYIASYFDQDKLMRKYELRNQYFKVVYESYDKQEILKYYDEIPGSKALAGHNK